MSEQSNQFPIDLVKDITQKYLCPGCICGCDPESCDKFKPNDKIDEGTALYGPVCVNHHSGTRMYTAIGPTNIMLGFPKGFNKVPCGYDTFNPDREHSYIEYLFDTEFDNTINMKFTIPFWKYLDEHGNTIVKYLCPRINKILVIVTLGNHIDKINCLELTKEDIEGMD